MADATPPRADRWRPFIIAGLVVWIGVVFVIDVVDSSVVIFSYLNLPVVASIALGRPRVTAALGGLAITLGVIDAAVNGYLGSVNGWVRLLLLLVFTTAALALSIYVEHIANRSRNVVDRLSGAMRSDLDAHVFWRPVRSPSRTITDFTFVDANDAACAFFRRSRDELIGHGIVELYPEFAQSPQFAMYTRLANTGEPVIVQAEEVQSVITGSRNTYDIRGIKVDSVLSISWRDVSSSIEARRVLTRSEEHFRLLAENASDVVWRTSNAGVLTWVSPSVSQTLGWRPAELIGHPTTEFLHPDDLMEARRARTEASGEHRSHLQVRLRTKDGSYRIVEVTGGPIVDRSGRPDGRAGGWRDVTNEVAARRELEAAETRFRMLATATNDVIVQTDRDFAVTWVSPSIRSALGWTIDGLLGRRAIELVHPDDLRAIAPQGIDAVEADGESEYTVRIAHASGGYRWMNVSTVVVPDGSGTRITRMHDVDDAVLHTQSLEHRLNTDALTGLASRGHALSRLETLTSERRVGSHVGLLLIDVDRFKDINDTYGHAVGDVVLQTIGSRIASQVRETDVTARLGGDELLVILNGVESTDAATMIANHVRTSCGQPIELADGRTVATTVSVGIALSLDGERAMDLLARADAAMYDAKRAGRDGVATNDPAN